MQQPVSKILRGALIVAMVVQFSGCGTLLYPERRGQKAGSLDAGVVILDGIGLLFFLLPGIIAFIVDFSNGTIYLPATAKLSAREIKFDPKTATVASIEQQIKDETGRTVHLNEAQTMKMRSKADALAYMQEYNDSIESNRLALAK